MRRICSIIISVFLLCAISGYALAASGSTTVYVTKTGDCYHAGTCSYLKSKISISLEDAVNAGYRPCSKCNPPRLDTSRSVVSLTPTTTDAPASSRSIPTTPPQSDRIEALKTSSATTKQPEPTVAPATEPHIVIQTRSKEEVNSERRSFTTGIVGVAVGAGIVALFNKKKR